MNDYRPLTTEEIEQLQQNGCWAEDWTSVNVAEDFNPERMRQVMLYGEVCIGSFDKSIEVSPGFHKHSGSWPMSMALVCISLTSQRLASSTSLRQVPR